MPKNLFQAVVFTLLMSFVMVYTMVCFNISLQMGKLTTKVFLIALQAMPLMWGIAALLEFFVIKNIATYFTFKILDHDAKPVFIIIVMSSMIVATMCPTMSLISILLYDKLTPDFIATWLQRIVINFPMALFFSLFYCGPLVRFIFRLIFVRKEANKKTNVS